LTYTTTTAANIQYVLPSMPTTTTTSAFELSGKLDTSMRVVAGRVVKIEVERFELTERREFPPAKVARAGT